jgi:hypothetical protein
LGIVSLIALPSSVQLRQAYFDEEQVAVTFPDAPYERAQLLDRRIGRNFEMHRAFRVNRFDMRQGRPLAHRSPPLIVPEETKASGGREDIDVDQ